MKILIIILSLTLAVQGKEKVKFDTRNELVSHIIDALKNNDQEKYLQVFVSEKIFKEANPTLFSNITDKDIINAKYKLFIEHQKKYFKQITDILKQDNINWDSLKVEIKESKTMKMPKNKKGDIDELGANLFVLLKFKKYFYSILIKGSVKTHFMKWQVCGKIELRAKKDVKTNEVYDDF